jgi:hypothetical protein
VEWIVFWSRNYAPFLRDPTFFDEYQLFFHFTIISYHPLLEKKYLTLKTAIYQLEKLVTLYGPERIIWRYDPIVIWEEEDSIKTNYNRREFELLCKEGQQLGLRSCYFSFVHPYFKFKQRLKKEYPSLRLVEAQHPLGSEILSEMRTITHSHGITLFGCCNDTLIGFNTKKGKCISGELLNKLKGQKTVSVARAPTRGDCGCTRSIDIGNYAQQPCPFGCIYCYANPVR